MLYTFPWTLTVALPCDRVLNCEFSTSQIKRQINVFSNKIATSPLPLLVETRRGFALQRYKEKNKNKKNQGTKKEERKERIGKFPSGFRGNPFLCYHILRNFAP